MVSRRSVCRTRTIRSTDGTAQLGRQAGGVWTHWYVDEVSDPGSDPRDPRGDLLGDRPGEPASRRRAVCPGSYDPVTNGHVDVIRRAATLFDEVVVAVMYNPAKQGAFPVEQRAGLITSALRDVPNLRVETYADRLLVDVCRELGAVAVVKGLRSGTDFAYELPMALMNRHLSGIETMFLPGDPRFEHVSSSLVKEVAAHGGDVRGLVPEAVFEALHARV
jgi:pantetheine-phosphate adenylyltransferase